MYDSTIALHRTVFGKREACLRNEVVYSARLGQQSDFSKIRFCDNIASKSELYVDSSRLIKILTMYGIIIALHRTALGKRGSLAGRMGLCSALGLACYSKTNSHPMNKDST